jgi:hypothetical protein
MMLRASSARPTRERVAAIAGGTGRTGTENRDKGVVAGVPAEQE